MAPDLALLQVRYAVAGISVIACGQVVLVALAAQVLFVVRLGPPTVTLALRGAAAWGAALTVPIVVTRALVRSAVAMHDELAEVI